MSEENAGLAVAAAPGPRPMRQVALTAVSWSATTELDMATWVEQGQRIGLMGRSAGWWIGDWLRYGNSRYGEKYARAMKITGYDTQTLMNMVYVASRYEFSRRREKLSWSHHAEAAALDAAERERLLQRAETDRLSVRDLRELIRIERLVECDSCAPNDEIASLLMCPECGYSFQRA
jgi:hypothetical protein